MTAPGSEITGESRRRRAFDRGFWSTGIMSLHATAAVITGSEFAATMTEVFALAAAIFWAHWVIARASNASVVQRIIKRWSA